jgi:two-component system, OmpR family, response regulator MprA
MVIPSRRAMGGSRKARARILLIEDDPTLRQIIRELLEYEGFEVSTAADDATSRALVRKQQFSLVVTDLFVPSADEATTRVRLLQKAVGSTPVVVMTGTWLGRDLSAEQLGVADLFFKPFDIEPFLDRITKLLRSGKSRRRR